MIGHELIGTAQVPDGVELRLMRRGDEFTIALDRNELMNTRVSASEEALARLRLDLAAAVQADARRKVEIGAAGRETVEAADADVRALELALARLRLNSEEIAATSAAPRDDLHGLLMDSSAAGFAVAMDVSCHSFVRCARLARPLMRAAGGGSLLTLSYHGADRVVEHYNLMGPVKAALEASVRALAVDLAPDGIRAHALSTGPVATRAASGIEHFDELIEAVRARTPSHRLVDLGQIGRVAAFLASEAAAPLSGSVTYADAGFHVIA